MSGAAPRLVAGMVVVLSVAACAGVPATHYYELRLAQDRARAVEAPASARGLAVGVQRFQIDPPYDQDRIVYRVGEDSAEIGFYAYHRWAAPLSRMLPLVAAKALQGTKGVSSIEPVVPGRHYEAHLEGRLLTLDEVDLPEGQLVRVRLVLALRLDGGAEIWSGTFGSESTARLGDVREVVESMSVALSETLNTARDRLAAVLEESPE